MSKEKEPQARTLTTGREVSVLSLLTVLGAEKVKENYNQWFERNRYELVRH